MKYCPPPRWVPVQRLAGGGEMRLRQKYGQKTMTGNADVHSSKREPCDSDLRPPSIYPLARAGRERTGSILAFPKCARPQTGSQGTSGARCRAHKELIAPTARIGSNFLRELPLSLRNHSPLSDSLSTFITLNSDVPTQALAKIRWALFGSW